MAKYAKTDRIKQKLEGKVKFGDDSSTDPNMLNPDLLKTLVDEAEAQLELDMMGRYEIPFKGADGVAFAALPSTTRVILTSMAEIMSCIRILESEFGRGTTTNGDKFKEPLQKRYDAMLKPLVEWRDQSYKTWKYPPLPNLSLAWNNQSDNGFAGQVINTTTLGHEADYAYKQINSAAENFWNGSIDALDGE